MKVLWFSNYYFSDAPDRGTGTWLGTMGRALVATGEIELFNVVLARVKEIEEEDSGGIHQYLLPDRWKLGKDQLPAQKYLDEIRQIVKNVGADLIHVWGLESSYFPLLVTRKIIQGENLLEIQGMCYQYSRNYMGGLSAGEQFRCIGLREILQPRGILFNGRRSYCRCQTKEEEMVRGFNHISYQSQWVHDNLIVMGARGKLHSTGIMLRDAFLSGAKWTWPEESARPVITTLIRATPYKGLQVLVRAIAILKRNGLISPEVQVRVIGNVGRSGPFGLFKQGYMKWLDQEMKRQHVLQNFVFLGGQTAEEMANHLRQSSVFVLPSFCETYCLAAAEAMALGVPCVISYAGALPELAEDGKSALYFPMGDVEICAKRILDILNNRDLATRLSANASETGRRRNAQRSCVERQMRIYNEIMLEKHEHGERNRNGK